MMDRLGQDIRYAWRLIAKRPLFALVAVLSIAIGVGATTTILSVVNSLLFTPPPGIDDPERVVEVGRSRGGQGFDTFSFPELLDMQERTRTLEHVAGYRMTPLSFSDGPESERVMGMGASAAYFPVFGVTPALGRFYTPEEDRVARANPVVVLSHAFWREHFGGDRSIIGKTIDLDRRQFTVIGVTPEEFHGHITVIKPDLYFPLTMWGISRPGFDEWSERRASWLTAVGRLAPGANIDRANAELKALFASFEQPNEDPRNARSASVLGIGTIPGAGRTPVTAFLALLLGLVAFVLLITCANVAGMLIARAVAREKEIAIRLAIGSTRAAIVRQLLVESLMLFALGGMGGVVLARWGAAALSAIRLPTPIPVELDFSADPRVLAAGLFLALLTGIVFGLAPALQSSRPELASALKSEQLQRNSRAGRLRRIFVMGQVALSLTLLACAGLFLRSLQRASGVDTGFNADGVHIVPFDLAMDGYDEARGRLFHQQLLEHVRQVPGVTAVATADDLPLDLGINENPVLPEGWKSAQPGDINGGLSSAFSAVGGDYFQALQIPLIRGRVFGSQDHAESARVVIVNRTFAERAWPGQEAIGKRVRRSTSDTEGLTVVGVVADVKNQTLMETVEPMIYTPVTQDYQSSLTLIVRGNASLTPAAIRGAIRSADPRLSLALFQRLDQYTSLGVMPQRVAAAVAAPLGLLALLLSALGVYGVIAFMVAQRTREIGTRIALGANRSDVVRLVVRDGVRLAAPGLLLGMLASLGIGRLIRSFILGVPSADPYTFVAVPLVMLLAIAFACFTPARRAASIQPIHALKSD